VPAEVAVGQLGERLLARQAPGPRQPLLEQDDGLLLALAWAEADQAVLREPAAGLESAFDVEQALGRPSRVNETAAG
jgi:hypothetical protein